MLHFQESVINPLRQKAYAIIVQQVSFSEIKRLVAQVRRFVSIEGDRD